jgi:serine O-acetyltransferase
MLKSLKKDLMRICQKRRNITIFLYIFHPRSFPIILIRLSQYFYKYKITKPFSYIFSLLNIIIFSIEVTPRCKIGEGLFIPHSLGTVIGATKIGKNCTLFQGVTLGAKYADLEFTEESRPIVLDNVTIGAGAKVLGGITIGNNVIIAANSLVINSIPDNVTVVGVPATIYKNDRVVEKT